MKSTRRDLNRRLDLLLKTFPAVLITGPRQCGKSTLLKMSCTDWQLLDLERPRDAERLSRDIEGFFDANSERVAIDEAQRLPQLFSALRPIIDRSSKKGRFILTGSASPHLMRGVSESLAGRIGILELAPFSFAESAAGYPKFDRWFWGGYPGLVHLKQVQARSLWLDAYVSTFLERDLPQLGVQLSVRRLRLLWTMLTHVHGNLLNVSDLARSLTVSPHTIGGDLDVLEGTFMIRRLQPFFANVQKRMTKAPKLYLRDSGLLHFLAGLRQPDELTTWPRRGQSFEGAVIEEIIALFNAASVRVKFYFWRTAAGAEVDLLIKVGQQLLPVEIKLSASVSHHDIAGLRQCMKDLNLTRGYVVCNATEPYAFNNQISVIPFKDIVARRFDFGLVTTPKKTPRAKGSAA